jgi:glycosyltransferase involved in cell wall biosynthesis
MLTLSIIVPTYNEEATIIPVLDRIAAHTLDGYSFEIIIVDDGSTDGTLGQLSNRPDLYTKLINHSINSGKGKALRTGIKEASGDFILFQDADLEYHPADYPKLLKPMMESNADVVYGSRFRGGESVRILFFWHHVGNLFLTLLSNIFTNLNLTDMETCFKLFRRGILERISLNENGFGIEPEITAKISNLKPLPRIYEVAISYDGRTYDEGKKIGWKDGIWAIICIVRYGCQRSKK